jgi:hypothetical protein
MEAWGNFRSLTRLVKRVHSFQHFITYYIRISKTKIKFGTSNSLHVEFTSYGNFKLETEKLPLSDLHLHACSFTKHCNS